MLRLVVGFYSFLPWLPRPLKYIAGEVQRFFLFYRAVTRQVISSDHLLEEMQMHGVQKQSPVIQLILIEVCFVLHTLAFFLEDDLK